MTHTDLSTMRTEHSHHELWVTLVAFLGFCMKQKGWVRILMQNLKEVFMKKVLFAFLSLILTGCGVAYQTTSLRDDLNANVRIIHLTADTILEANNSPYEPKKWPNILSSIGKVHNQNRGKFPFSDPLIDHNELPGAIETILPEFDQPQPYEIGVSDVISMSTPIAESLLGAFNGLLANENSRQGYTVQDNGAVSIPEIGRVFLGGLTLEEAEDVIYQKFVEVGVTPSFSIEVTEFNSQRVYVNGNVVSPGVESITLQPLYLDQAIYRRGGIAISNASYVIIRLYRNESIFQIFGSELYNQSGDKRILLKDGDRVVVDLTDDYDNALGLQQQARGHMLKELELASLAEANKAEGVLSQLEYGAISRDYVYIIGEVLKQSRFALPFENKAFLADALIQSAGGVLSLSGDPKQIYVLRGTSDLRDFEEITAFNLDIRNAANLLLATRLELRPKDVVFVGTQPITNWNRIIAQIIPSLGLSNINTLNNN